MTAAACTILVVEDDLHIRRLLRGALVRGGHDVIEAATAREGLSVATARKPQVVLLDLGLPDRDGLELIQALKTGAAIIVVSAREATDEKVAALDLGADDYVTKPFDTDELLARVRTVLRHRQPATIAGPIRFGDVTIDTNLRRVTRGGIDVHLTPKEYDVLSELARKPDRVVGHRAILRSVWGAAHEDDIDYLRIVVRALRQKLEPNPAQPTWLINEPGVGYWLRTQ
ncbi:response regulator transcription factor [Roseomonas aeriglobus]|nr:response regulator transcription factor [Roseomonas aeriglobus]